MPKQKADKNPEIQGYVNNVFGSATHYRSKTNPKKSKAFSYRFAPIIVSL